MRAYRHTNWFQLIGAFVEIRHNNRTVRSGFVDDAMPDSSALWLAADGIHTRAIFEAAEGYAAWVQPQELRDKQCYRMTASALGLKSQIKPPLTA